MRNQHLVKRKKVELEEVISSLRQDIEEYSIKATEKDNLTEMSTLLTIANSFRDAVKTKLETVKDLDKAASKLEKEIKCL